VIDQAAVPTWGYARDRRQQNLGSIATFAPPTYDSESIALKPSPPSAYAGWSPAYHDVRQGNSGSQVTFVDDASAWISTTSTSATFLHIGSSREPSSEDVTIMPPPVFTVSHQTKILATTAVEIRTAELPRWKPRINLDLTEFEADE